MPKAEFGTTKWMSNRIKASGLQKLRWYCQMCQKQCRDENGFKCHRMSEGHQRMMQVFIQDPNKFMDEFSQDFEREFMRLMRTRYCRTRVLANSVYNNIVADRQHIHMNATIWVTLSEFVQYLGSTNKCKIELTPKGWYVEYIDHEELRRLEARQKRRKEELSQEEAKARRLGELVEEAEKQGKFQQPVYTPLVRNEGEKVVIGSLKGVAKGGVGGALERPVNALQQLEEKLKAESRNEAQTRHSHTCEADAVALGAPAVEKESRSVSRLRTDAEGDPVAGSCPGPLPARRLEDARRDEVSDVFATYLRSGLQKRSGAATAAMESPQPPTKQRRLLAMERVRIEEERKKQRALWCGDGGGGHSEVGMGKQSPCEGAASADGGTAARPRPLESKGTGREKGETLAPEHEDYQKNTEESDEREISYLRPAVEPPPHKYQDGDWWLCKGLIVKVVHKTLGDGQFYKQKGRVIKVENRYSGYIQMLDSGAVLRLDQRNLETVIPNIGGWVRITLGLWRDHEGVLEALDVDNYCVHVVLKTGPLFRSSPSARPFVLKHLPYEHVCRIERRTDDT